MKLPRRSQSPGRQRRRPAAKAAANQAASTRRRFDLEPNTGRHEQAAGPAGSRLAYWLQRFGLIVLSLAALASVVNVLTLSNKAKVMPLQQAQDSFFLRDVQAYESAASQLLSDSVWNRNKITVDTNKVSKKMLERFPELTSASITVPLLSHRPIVYIQPSQPVLVLSANNGSFVIAGNGKALMRGDSPETLGQAHLPVIKDQSGLPVALNRQALPRSTIMFVREVIYQLANKQLRVESMNLPPSSSQLDVKLAGQPYHIKYNLQSGTAREQTGTYLAAIEEIKKHNQQPGEYVDVRVAGRAYYR